MDGIDQSTVGRKEVRKRWTHGLSVGLADWNELQAVSLKPKIFHLSTFVVLIVLFLLDL